MRPLVATILVGSLFSISWAAAGALFAILWWDTTPLPLAGFMGALGAGGLVWAGQKVRLW